MANQKTLTTDRMVQARMVLEAPVAEQPHEGHWPQLIDTLAIQPSVSSLPQRLTTSIIEMHQQTMTVSQQQGLPVQFVGYAPASADTHLFRGRTSDWALMALGRDPLYIAQNHKLLLPKAALTDLARIYQAGLNFDALYIAHELPKDSVKPGQAVPVALIAPPPPPQIADQLAKVEAANQTLWQAFRTGLRGLALGAAVTVAAPVVVASAVGMSALGAASLDPIIFGLNFDRAITLNGQPLALWYYLTHWYWPAAK